MTNSQLLVGSCLEEVLQGIVDFLEVVFHFPHSFFLVPHLPWTTSPQDITVVTASALYSLRVLLFFSRSLFSILTSFARSSCLAQLPTLLTFRERGDGAESCPAPLPHFFRGVRSARCWPGSRYCEGFSPDLPCALRLHRGLTGGTGWEPVGRRLGGPSSQRWRRK